MRMPTVLAAALLLALSPARADDPPNMPGAHILHDYVLTMDKVKAYDAAYNAMEEAAIGDEGLKADIDAAVHDDGPQIADTIAKMDRHPRVYAFFEAKGLSKMEAVLLPIVVRAGCLALKQPTLLATYPAVIAQGHIDFCKAHHAELETLEFLKFAAQQF